MNPKEMPIGFSVGRVSFKNRVMTASGTFDPEAYPFDPNSLGAVVLKSLTREPRVGNPQPRLAEVRGGLGLINSIGLENPGVIDGLRGHADFLNSLQTAVIASVAGHSEYDYGFVVAQFECQEWIDAVEVNLGCPNVPGGLAIGTNPALAFSLISFLRKATGKPLIAKLTPNVTDIRVVARAVVEAGADALTLINTVRGRVKLPTGWVSGGLSGPAITPIAMQMVYDVRQVLPRIPIFAAGGIDSVKTALEFFECGATAVQVGTASFSNPCVMQEIVLGLESALGS